MAASLSVSSCFNVQHLNERNTNYLNGVRYFPAPQSSSIKIVFSKNKHTNLNSRGDFFPYPKLDSFFPVRNPVNSRSGFFVKAGRDPRPGRNYSFGSNPEPKDSPTKYIQIFLGSLLVGLVLTGQLNIFDAIGKFVLGTIFFFLLAAVGGIFALQRLVDANPGGSQVTVGNCPSCGTAQKVLTSLSTFGGQPVAQRCLSCGEVFTVEDGAFVRANPMFQGDRKQSDSTFSGSGGTRGGFGQTSASEASGSRSGGSKATDIIDVQAVISDKE